MPDSNASYLVWNANFDSIFNAPIGEAAWLELPSKHPIKEFDGAWLKLKGSDSLPNFMNFSPGDHPRLLKWLMIFDAIALSDTAVHWQFNVSLAGTAVDEMAGKPLKGLSLSDFTKGESYTTRHRLMSQALNDKHPMYGHSVVSTLEHSSISDDTDSAAQLDIGFYPFSNGAKPPRIIVLPIPRNNMIRSFL